jgi:hypothetical protein
MSLDLVNVAGTVPGGTQFPGSVQGLLDLIAEYMAISGGAGYIPINFGPNTPGINDRDNPWFRTDNNGVPIGWFSWNGTEWEQMPVDVVSGDTAHRPAGVQGQQYFDTDIKTQLVFDRGIWRTVTGCPGDVKFVRSCYNGGNGIADPSMAQVLTANPGWDEWTPGAGRVLGGTGTGAGLTERTLAEEVGSEAVVLTEAQLAAHTHTVAGAARIMADGNVSNPGGIIASYSSVASGSTGTDEAHPNMQPTTFLHCIWKL